MGELVAAHASSRIPVDTVNRPRRPVAVEPSTFDQIEGAMDPALQLQIAHDTASALVARVRDEGSAETLSRILSYTSEYGVGELAELWASAPAHSLPGALWRLYVIHASIIADPAVAAHAYQHAIDNLNSIDEVVAGARQPTGPEDIRDMADAILRGAFTGDLADALDRAAAYCRIEAHGVTSLIANTEIGTSAMLERAVTLADFAADLNASAALARVDKLT
jgi:hypothetical protein